MLKTLVEESKRAGLKTLELETFRQRENSALVRNYRFPASWNNPEEDLQAGQVPRHHSDVNGVVTLCSSRRCFSDEKQQLTLTAFAHGIISSCYRVEVSLTFASAF